LVDEVREGVQVVDLRLRELEERGAGGGGGGGDDDDDDEDDDDDDSGCPTSPKAAVPGEREVLLEMRASALSGGPTASSRSSNGAFGLTNRRHPVRQKAAAAGGGKHPGAGGASRGNCCKG
jgi:hypothetical protein